MQAKQVKSLTRLSLIYSLPQLCVYLFTCQRETARSSDMAQKNRDQSPAVGSEAVGRVLALRTLIGGIPIAKIASADA